MRPVETVPDFSLPQPLPLHPRLLVSSGDWERIRHQLKSDPVSARIFAALRKKAALLLDTPPLERIMNGFRLQAVETTELQKPFDAPNPGVKRITIRSRTEAGQGGRLRVFAIPKSGNGVSAPPLQALSEWS